MKIADGAVHRQERMCSRYPIAFARTRSGAHERSPAAGTKCSLVRIGYPYREPETLLSVVSPRKAYPWLHPGDCYN